MDNIQSELQKLKHAAATGPLNTFNVGAPSANPLKLYICEVMKRKYMGYAYMPTNTVVVRVLDGSGQFLPIDEFLLTARNVSGQTFSESDKVFVMQSETYGPLIISGAFGSGSPSAPFTVHGHQGWWDGGFASFLSGGR